MVWSIPARRHHTASHCTTLHYTAPHCTTLHHTAIHYNTLRHTASLHNGCQTCKRAMSHTCMSHVTRINASFTHMNESRHTWTHHVTHMYESCHIVQQFCTPQIWGDKYLQWYFFVTDLLRICEVKNYCTADICVHIYNKYIKKIHSEMCRVKNEGSVAWTFVFNYTTNSYVHIFNKHIYHIYLINTEISWVKT